MDCDNEKIRETIFFFLPKSRPTNETDWAVFELGGKVVSAPKIWNENFTACDNNFIVKVEGQLKLNMAYEINAWVFFLD